MHERGRGLKTVSSKQTNKDSPRLSHSSAYSSNNTQPAWIPSRITGVPGPGLEETWVFTPSGEGAPVTMALGGRGLVHSASLLMTTIKMNLC